MTGTTIGGVVLGLMILGYQLFLWWPGLAKLRKKPIPYLQQLLPFLAAWVYGVLGTLCAMGLIGWAFDTALWASNWLGDAALWIGVGEDAGQTASGAPIPLTTFGNCMVLIATACMIAALKRTGRNDLKLGMWCGLCLGTSSSVAGLAAVPIAQSVNAIGSTVFGAIG